jgi:hypothetical protein
MPDIDVLTPEERCKQWSQVFGYLADDRRASTLVEALNAGDRKQIEALLEPTGVLTTTTCISVHEALTAVINSGPGHYQKTCEVLPWLRPPHVSDTDGRAYRLSDGQFLWLTEAEWWAYLDRAVSDRAWLEANSELLHDLGIASCSWTWVSDSRIVTIDRSRTMCFSGTIPPR